MSQHEIVASYPELSDNDINAAIQYAADALRNGVLIDVKHAR